MTRRASLLAAGAYLLAALIFTWPLATVIGSEIAWDMGDSLFNSWVLLWTGGQVMAFLSGDFTALNRFWHGNIFYPERLTVAFSEHLVPQMLQALPILATTDNVVLAYNLLFLSTFVLSGLGMFLLVRELTGSAVAGFVAGLAFAFAPFRVAHFSHLQVLSAQWMPFVLYGYRRYFETGQRRPLIGGTVALVLQNLSCGYYLLFFAPFVGLYVIYEMVSRGRLTDWRQWRTWVVTGVLALAFTFPFLEPYFDIRKHIGVGVRTTAEIAEFSADTHAFATSAGFLWFWGDRLPQFNKPEGEGFPGLTILLLALIGAGAGLAGAIRRARAMPATTIPPWRQALVGCVTVLCVAHVIGALTYLITGGLPYPTEDGWMVARDANGFLLRTLALLIALVVASPGVRGVVRGVPGSLVGFFVLSTGLAALLALGPEIMVAGTAIGTGPYAWLVAWVPGFDGVRVPARYLMLVALFLAGLAGYGAAAVWRWHPRIGMAGLVVAGLLIVGESWPGVFKTNVRLWAEGVELTPRDLRMGDDLPPIYKHLRDDPSPVVLVEFPFGTVPWDLHAQFYAGYHRRSLVNGFSGFFPESQRTLANVFGLVRSDPDAAWRGLVGTRATHALVHKQGFISSRRDLYTVWLEQRGAVRIMSDGHSHLYRLR